MYGWKISPHPGKVEELVDTATYQSKQKFRAVFYAFSGLSGEDDWLPFLLL
jgi:hypothetical protein